MAVGGAEVGTGLVAKSLTDGKVGSKVSPSKTGSQMPAPSSTGCLSSSKMSMRSIASTAPKAKESKSSPKTGIEKKSSPVKPSTSKK